MTLRASFERLIRSTLWLKRWDTHSAPWPTAMYDTPPGTSIDRCPRFAPGLTRTTLSGRGALPGPRTPTHTAPAPAVTMIGSPVAEIVVRATMRTRCSLICSSERVGRPLTAHTDPSP